MEFHHSQLGANRHRLADHGLDCEFTDEDDAFHAELRRQVLLLTTEEDEDFAVEAEAGYSSFHSAYKPGSNGLTNHFPTTSKPGSYFSWWEREKGDAVPTWLVDLWRTGKGTGVFIPQIVGSRRRYKHGRVENGRRRVYTCRQATIRHEHTAIALHIPQADSSLPASGSRISKCPTDKT